MNLTRSAGVCIIIAYQKTERNGMRKASELNVGEIEKKIGYTFKDKSLLIQAFTRTSFCNEINPTVKTKYHSNEVLEFFGDGVLSLSIISFLLKECTERYEHGIKTELGEGDFSNIKSKLSDKQNLSKSMKALGLEKPLLSVDTYHPETARFALELGVEILNDISGAEDPEMIRISYELLNQGR